MTAPIIETPKGRIVTGADNRAQLVFNPNFAPTWQRRYTAAQFFVDSEVLRLSEPYTPHLTGMLIASGILGTDPGSGLVQWIAPYAKNQYYSPRRPGSQSGALRGPYWFERMKAVRGQKIITGARRLAGSGQST